MTFSTGVKLVMLAGVILDILIIWLMFRMLDVIPDKLEDFIKSLF